MKDKYPKKPKPKPKPKTIIKKPKKNKKSLIKYHSSCRAKKPKTEIQKEILRLQKRADRDILNKDKEKLRKEIIKLKKMINK